VRLDWTNEPDTNVFVVTQYLCTFEQIWNTKKLNMYEWNRLPTFCSTLTKDIRATTSGARGGGRRGKTVKSIKMEENQSTLKRMNCKLSSLQILECIRQAVWRRKKKHRGALFVGSLFQLSQAAVCIRLYNLLITCTLLRIKQYKLWVSDHGKEM